MYKVSIHSGKKSGKLCGLTDRQTARRMDGQMGIKPIVPSGYTGRGLINDPTLYLYFCDYLPFGEITVNVQNKMADGGSEKR
jgi:hypothetical protein